jgi:antitoxin MazE
MSNIFKTRIVQVGNSQGIRLPKAMIELSGIKEHIEIEVKDRQIIITAASKARVGWGDAFAQMASNGDELAPLTVSNSWDETEWTW